MQCMHAYASDMKYIINRALASYNYFTTPLFSTSCLKCIFTAFSARKYSYFGKDHVCPPGIHARSLKSDSNCQKTPILSIPIFVYVHKT